MIARGKAGRLDFILAGAQKCGSTALHYFLERHPQIALPDKQELHFFDEDENFSGPVDYRKLHRHFKPKKNATIAGENTPVYIYWKPALERIRDYHREIKLILLLRNPMRRAFSHWNMQRERGFETLDFLNAVREEPERLRQELPRQSRRFSYIDRGFYSEQLERLFRLFPREQVQVIKFEEFRANQPATMEAVFRFLGVEPLPRLRNKERNLIRYAREMTKREQQVLAEIYRDEIPKVERLLGWDCSDWKEVS